MVGICQACRSSSKENERSTRNVQVGGDATADARSWTLMSRMFNAQGEEQVPMSPPREMVARSGGTGDRRPGDGGPRRYCPAT